jgi:hypothetical protein
LASAEGLLSPGQNPGLESPSNPAWLTDVETGERFLVQLSVRTDSTVAVG